MTTNTTNKSPSPHPNATATEPAEASQRDQETVFEIDTDKCEYDDDHDMNDNLQDWMTPVTPIPGQSPIPSLQKEDNDTQEIYSNFAKGYRLPTSRQRSQPVPSTAIETN